MGESDSSGSEERHDYQPYADGGELPGVLRKRTTGDLKEDRRRIMQVYFLTHEHGSKLGVIPKKITFRRSDK